MTSILSFLKALWPWRRRPTPAAEPPPPGDLVVDIAPEPVPPLAAAPSPAVETPEEDEAAREEPQEEEEEKEKEEEEEEDWAAGEVEDEDPLAPDPFISVDGPIIEAFSPDTVRLRRAEAMILASSGEHRIFLSDVAGPGTLAEALDQLLQEGRVTAEFRDDEAEGPYIHYRPQD